jgi:lipid II:glycine glycyltransferase (peptidoglycan interpeptide bridge formation enzyme)
MHSQIWQVEVDRTGSAEWSQMLDLFEDANIYQTAAYAEVRWGERNISRLVLKNSGKVVGMAQLRIIRPTPFKYGLAYLRWGPLWERRCYPPDSEVPTRMAQAIGLEYAKNRGLFVHIIPNAFVNTMRADVFRASFKNFMCGTNKADRTYRTFLMDLTPSLEEIRLKLDKKWRNQLTCAEKNNLYVIAGNDSNLYRIFCDIYYQMRQRKTFETTVDADEFRRIQEALTETQRMRVLICMANGVPVAGIVASTIGDCAIYLLGATGDDGMKSKGSYLLQWSMICWLKAHGIKSYDLGGIDPKNNQGVFHFKRGLAGVDTCLIQPYTASTCFISSLMGKASMIMHYARIASSRPRNYACFANISINSNIQ